MAWVLGLLHSSGSLVGRDPTIRWQATTEEPIAKVRACLRSTHPIWVYDRGANQPIHVLAINRLRMRAEVDELVSARLQAERCRLPNVPPHLLQHFVRGYVEGKGLLRFDQKRSLTVAISGNTRFMTDLRQRLLAAGFPMPPSLRPMTSTPSSSILALSHRKAFRVVDFLYRDAPEAQRITSNWDIYERCRQWREQRGLDSDHVG